MKIWNTYFPTKEGPRKPSALRSQNCEMYHQHHAREPLTTPPEAWWRCSHSSIPRLEAPQARSGQPLPTAARHPPPQSWAGSRSLIKALQVIRDPELCFVWTAGLAAIHLPSFHRDQQSRLGAGGRRNTRLAGHWGVTVTYYSALPASPLPPREGGNVTQRLKCTQARKNSNAAQRWWQLDCQHQT